MRTETYQGPKTLELVVFRLEDGSTREQFLTTVDAVSKWAKAQPGFISRDLTYAAGEDKWIDVVWWESIEDAEVAADAAASSDACAPMFGLIDLDQAQMLHGEPATTSLSSAEAVSHSTPTT